ncbi:MAG: alpha/beta hydrolase [Burkholderiaceae bacterium]|nr:alpha/beta hydrolase [Burkholderiaceae bacterium]
MTTWVLLRGLVREQRHWGRFPELLQAAFPEARIVTLDLPGNGSLVRETSPTTVEDMAEFCRAELHRHGIAPPYKLLALSLGAMVAVAWNCIAPEEVSGSVLINTSMRPFSPFYRRLKPQNYARLLRCLKAEPAEREKLILEMTSNRSCAQAAVLQDWIAYQREAPVSAPNALRQLWAAMRFRARQCKPCTRLLILGSTADGLVDNECSRQLAALWHAEAAFHPSAGHDLPLDDGPWIVEQIKSWMEMEKTPSEMEAAK